MRCVLMEPRAETRRERLVRAGRWLAEARENKGLTGRAMAAQLGVSPQVLSSYERGMVQVPDDRAAQIAAVLGLGPSETREGLGLFASPGAPKDDQSVVWLPKDVELSPKQRRALNRIVDAFIDSVRQEHEEDPPP